MTIFDLEKSDVPSAFSCETVIIGAGAVGITMAAELARRGHDVILLEAGGISLETRSQNIFTNARSSGFNLTGLHSGRFRLLGGTTNFWGGELLPFDPIVFEDRPALGIEPWPFDRQALDPYYARAMSLLGMDGGEPTDAAVWTRANAKLPDLDEGLELLFTRWAKTPNLAKFFKADLVDAGVRVLVHANVCGFEPDDTGERIARVHMRTFGGRRATVAARRTVLACGTIEIARLLMMPYVDGRKTPWNDNPWLGRGYIDHLDTTAGTVAPKSRETFHNLFENLFFDGYKYNPKIKLSERAQRERSLLGVAGAFIFKTSYQDNAENIKLFLRSVRDGRLPPNWWQLPGHALALAKVLAPFAYRYFHDNRTFHPSGSTVLFRVTSEQLPQRDSRITLQRERDALEMPLVEVNWKVDGAELETIAYFSEQVRDALKKAGIADLELEKTLVARDPAYMADASDTYHQMGGARMGRDAGDGVVDRNLRVHGVADLYVAGAAVMPSTGFANCTLTAIALGLRLCDHLVGERVADQFVSRSMSSRLVPVPVPAG
jgi:choline dehydrogenase-like flavoprotein